MKRLYEMYFDDVGDYVFFPCGAVQTGAPWSDRAAVELMSSPIYSTRELIAPLS